MTNGIKNRNGLVTRLGELCAVALQRVCLLHIVLLLVS